MLALLTSTYKIKRIPLLKVYIQSWHRQPRLVRILRKKKQYARIIHHSELGQPMQMQWYKSYSQKALMNGMFFAL